MSEPSNIRSLVHHAIGSGTVGTRSRLVMLINMHTVLIKGVPEGRENDHEHNHHVKMIQTLTHLLEGLDRDVADMRKATVGELT